MDLVSRAGWGARAPKSTSTNIQSKGFTIHYSGADADEESDHAKCPGRVRGIQNFHMDGRKWADIAYNFLVCKHGTIYEGRGFGHRSAAQGTNAGNDQDLAICFLGDDTVGRDDVTDAGRRAIVDLIALGRRDHGVGTNLHGHRDWHSTSCPGDELYAWIKAGLPLGSGPTTGGDDDMPFTEAQLKAIAKAGAIEALDAYGYDPTSKTSLLGRLDADTDKLGPILDLAQRILKQVTASGGAGTGTSPATLAAALRAAADKLA